MYSETALGGGWTTQFEKYLSQNVWKIWIFPKLKLSEHHLVSSFFKLIPNQPNQPNQPNNPTQPHLGKPPACSGSQPSNLKPSPQMEGAKDPGIGSHFDIQKVETLSSKALPQKKKNMVFSLGKPKYPTFRQL